VTPLAAEARRQLTPARGRRTLTFPMKPSANSPNQVPRAAFSAGTYIGCGACGRLLKIEWPTRSILCSCGARILAERPQADDTPEKQG
jgi:DNA-directed RNA polymerase subunit RPC12/RpoP